MPEADKRSPYDLWGALLLLGAIVVVTLVYLDNSALKTCLRALANLGSICLGKPLEADITQIAGIDPSSMLSASADFRNLMLGGLLGAFLSLAVVSMLPPGQLHISTNYEIRGVKFQLSGAVVLVVAGVVGGGFAASTFGADARSAITFQYVQELQSQTRSLIEVHDDLIRTHGEATEQYTVTMAQLSTQHVNEMRLGAERYADAIEQLTAYQNTILGTGLLAPIQIAMQVICPVSPNTNGLANTNELAFVAGEDERTGTIGVVVPANWLGGNRRIGVDVRQAVGANAGLRSVGSLVNMSVEIVAAVQDPDRANGLGVNLGRDPITQGRLDPVAAAPHWLALTQTINVAQLDEFCGGRALAAAIR